MDTILRDLRYAVRGLLRSRGFTSVALLTLALGIGASTAIFSIVSGVILRPLPYPKSEQLMHLSTQEPALGLMRFWVSVPEYLEFQKLNQSFAVVGAYQTGETDLTAGDSPLGVRSAFVDEHLLSPLGEPRACSARGAHQPGRRPSCRVTVHGRDGFMES
jgi:putative ABC transport system permease protein